ncbi:suppressor of fused domain protein [Pseudomonas frederiksbergensis]|uniref:suppressor of fused domain protein n=1 Tax=Pseudomonas frederiksbergensis TaxID=104087 RepID=UPI003D1AD025
MKIPPSPHRKAVANHTLKIFQGAPVVHAYYDEAKVRSFSILTTNDSVEDGIKSIGTIGLSEVPLTGDDGQEFITRIELCSAVPISVDLWDNIVASAAFYIEQRRRAVIPGDILENIVGDYYPDTKMPHLYFSIPFLWNDGHFEELLVSSLRVNWLQCFAIHESEKEFVKMHGYEAFEDLMSDQEIDIFNSERAAAIFN